MVEQLAMATKRSKTSAEHHHLTELIKPSVARSSTDSAEQPVTSRPEPASSRARILHSAQSAGKRKAVGTVVAYLACQEEAPDFNINRDRHDLMEAVHNAIEVGADIINIAFTTSVSKHLVDIKTILPELTSAFDAKWTSSVGQPAYSCRSVGSVISFFSASCGSLLFEAILDPEGSLPAIMLTFGTPTEILCTITTSLPVLTSRSRERMLNTYANAAATTNAETIFIGGVSPTPSSV